jgi:hypothetical protein
MASAVKKRTVMHLAGKGKKTALQISHVPNDIFLLWEFFSGIMAMIMMICLVRNHVATTVPPSFQSYK